MPAVLLAAPFLLVACNSGAADRTAGDAADSHQTASEAGEMPTPANEPTAQSSPSAAPTPVSTASTDMASDQADMTPAELVPEAEKGEKGARNVLLFWAAALEQKQFAKAWAQFGDGGKRSGMSQQQYARSFAPYATITVAMPTGGMEGAAGSLYYTAPTTISGTLKSGGTYTLKGPVVLRRVNDVPGATAEQLRWHIYSTDLKRVDGA